jgi:hypothetical protein
MFTSIQQLLLVEEDIISLLRASVCSVGAFPGSKGEAGLDTQFVLAQPRFY